MFITLKSPKDLSKLKHVIGTSEDLGGVYWLGKFDMTSRHSLREADAPSHDGALASLFRKLSYIIRIAQHCQFGGRTYAHRAQRPWQNFRRQAKRRF